MNHRHLNSINIRRNRVKEIIQIHILKKQNSIGKK
jgi:hypothetical protein